MKRACLSILLLIVTLMACAPPQAITSAAQLTTATQVPTATLQPTAIPTPSPTPSSIPPTATPQPTSTPLPTVPATATVVPTTLLADELAQPAMLQANNAPASTNAVNPPVRLMIPVVGIDGATVSVGLDENAVPIVPKHDIGWYNLSATPGNGENVVFWGHVLRFTDAPQIPAPFARLREAPLGADVLVYTADGVEHRYQIVEQVWVTPDQVQYILPQGREVVTMVSCIGDQVVENGEVVEMTHRLITIAAPVS
jgi:sortase (surface protein transpeptidase)